VMRQTPQALKARLNIVFDGEAGLDYGGVSRGMCDGQRVCECMRERAMGAIITDEGTRTVTVIDIRRPLTHSSQPPYAYTHTLLLSHSLSLTLTLTHTLSLSDRVVFPTVQGNVQSAVLLVRVFGL
jgi:hypothetical protein